MAQTDRDLSTPVPSLSDIAILLIIRTDCSKAEPSVTPWLPWPLLCPTAPHRDVNGFHTTGARAPGTPESLRRQRLQRHHVNGGPPYPCTSRELALITDKTIRPNVAVPVVATEKAVSDLEDASRPYFTNSTAAVVVLQRFRDKAKKPLRWGPDLVFKAFGDFGIELSLQASYMVVFSYAGRRVAFAANGMVHSLLQASPTVSTSLRNRGEPRSF